MDEEYFKFCASLKPTDKLKVGFENGSTFDTKMSLFYYFYNQTLEGVKLKMQCVQMCNQELYYYMDKTSFYSVVPALILSIVGTVLILFAVAPNIKKSSANWYIVVLSLTEMSWLLVMTLANIDPRSFMRTTDGLCKFTSVMLELLELISVYVLLAMTAERAFVVIAPLKAMTSLNIKTSMVATSLVSAVSVAICMPLGWMYAFIGFDPVTNTPMCYSSKQYIPYTFSKPYVVVFLRSVLKSFVPTILLFVMNSVIIFFIRKHTKQKSEMTAAKDAVGKRNEQQITTMLVTVSVVFMVLSLPTAASIIFRDEVNLYVCKNEEMYAVVNMVAFVTRYFSHAINAYMYCLCSASFRAQLARRLGVKDKSASSGAYSETKVTSVSATVSS